MKTTHQMRHGFTLVELLVVIAIIATLAGVATPVILNAQKKGAMAEAISNSKQIGIALFTFDQDYGSYPSDATATAVRDNNPATDLALGTTSSNDYFRQLIAAGAIDSEKPFYAKAPYTKKPDSAMVGVQALAAGEVGFAYIMATATEALSSSGNSGQPLLAAAVYNAATDGTFDPDIYDKKAVVFHIDNSATLQTVRVSDKKVSVGNGKTLLDNGTGTVWGTGITPAIKAPLKSSAS